MSSDLASSEEPDSPEAAPVSPDYVPGPEEPEQAPLSPDYVPGPEYPEYLALSDEEVPVEDQPYAVADSPITLSLGYVADSDPEEDPEEDSEDGPVDYPTNRGDGDRAVETDESAATPPSPLVYHTTARISIQPEAPMPFSSEEEVERLLALPPPPPSPLISLSPPSAEERLARCLAAPALPSSPLPPPLLSLHLPSHVPTTLPLPSSPLPASLFIPPLVDRREDIPEAELPPCKRLCMTSLTSRYDVGESSTAAHRPTGGHGIDYGFIGTLDAKTRRQRAEEVSYGIRDVYVDPTEAVEEVAPTTLEGVNARMTELAAVQEQDTQDVYAVIRDTQDRQTQLFQRVDGLVEDRQFHYKTARLLDQEALVSLEAWVHSIGLSSAFDYELQAYRTHTQM
ncbi:hypothetical protein Tco_1076428 [Tanacetum coccineum]